ncbi:MAG: hypothetical protein U0798_15335 [Gemmataceae bacterium]
MKSHPMIFSTEMVRAIRDGRKSMTRRIVKEGTTTPKVSVGDEIWIKETWRPCEAGGVSIEYKVGGRVEANDDSDLHNRIVTSTYARTDRERDEENRRNAGEKGISYRWRNAMFMPKWASRITLRVTSVRIERLWEITDKAAIAEGCKKCGESGWVFEGSGYDKARLCHSAPSTAFACRWDELHKPGRRWEDNPTVMVIGFERQETGKV